MALEKSLLPNENATSSAVYGRFTWFKNDEVERGLAQGSDKSFFWTSGAFTQAYAQSHSISVDKTCTVSFEGSWRS